MCLQRFNSKAIKNRLTVSVEGTMRRSEVVENTVQKFKEADYKGGVAVYCCTPRIYSDQFIFKRYASEVELYGSGRLADFNSHDQACSGLLQTLDDAYGNDMIDRIHLRIFGSKLVADYHRSNSSWSITAKPGFNCTQSRKEQLARPELALVFMRKAL